MNVLSAYLKGFTALLYPRICVVCNSSLVGNEDQLCTLCRHSLPETNFHTNSGNPVEQLFWGRFPVKNATSLLFFEKGSKYRNLLHMLKYQGRTDVGYFLGRLLGNALKSAAWNDLDAIVPVPLHRKKYFRRGFNQSEIIASACAPIMGIKMYPRYVKRNVATDTQTKRRRYERWENVENVFSCRPLKSLEGKHILIVDDVVTTGATLEAMANSILRVNPEAKLSVATLAFAYG